MDRKNVLALGILIAIISSFAFAGPTGFMVLTQSKQALEGYFEGGALKQIYIDQMNAQAGQVPGQIASLFGNNKINIHITLDDGSVMGYYAETRDAKVSQVLEGTKAGADLEIRLSEGTIDRIALSKAPVDEFLKAMGSGEIKYRGLTPEGEAKGLIVNVTTAVVGFFKGLFDFISGLLG